LAGGDKEGSRGKVEKNKVKWRVERKGDGRLLAYTISLLEGTERSGGKRREE